MRIPSLKRIQVMPARKRLAIAGTSVLIIALPIVSAAIYFLSAARWAGFAFSVYVYNMFVSVVFGFCATRYPQLLVHRVTRYKRSAMPHWWNRLWSLLKGLIENIADAACWPVVVFVMFLSFIRLRRFRNKGFTPQALQTILVSEAAEANFLYSGLVVFGITLLMYRLTVGDALPSSDMHHLMYAPILTVILRQLGALSASGGSLGMYKRQDGNPLLKFAIAAFSDFATLVIALTALANWGKHPAAVNLKDIASRMLTLNMSGSKALSIAIQHPFAHVAEMDEVDRLVSLAGAVVYFSLISTVTGVKSFKRNDEEHLAVARLLTLKGEYVKAISELDDVPKTLITQRARIVPLLASGKLSAAEGCADSVLRFDPHLERVPTVDDVYLLLSTEASAAAREVRFNLFRGALAKGVSLGLLSFLLSNFERDSALIQRIMETSSKEELFAPGMGALYLNNQKPSPELNRAFLNSELPARPEDLYAALYFRLVARIFGCSGVEDARNLLEEWSISEGAKFCELGTVMLEAGLWAQIFVIVASRRMIEIARATQSPQISSWANLNSAAIRSINRTEIGRAILLGLQIESKSGYAGFSEWFA